jgi:hypothetical protein
MRRALRGRLVECDTPPSRYWASFANIWQGGGTGEGTGHIISHENRKMSPAGRQRFSLGTHRLSFAVLRLQFDNARSRFRYVSSETVWCTVMRRMEAALPYLRTAYANQFNAVLSSVSNQVKIQGCDHIQCADFNDTVESVPEICDNRSQYSRR